MYMSSILATIPVLALFVSAAPADMSSFAAAPPSLEARDETFNIHVFNNCPFQKEVGIYGVSPSFDMISYMTPCTIPAGGNSTIQAPFKGVGLRLVGHAEWGLAGQWAPQALFEFGYSSYQGQQGTAYDLSLMKGSDMDVSMKVSPIDNGKGSGSCDTKLCYPWDPENTQCWTDPNQVDNGSPADTVCYKGKTDFQVTYCAT